ncbi:MAG: Zn-dependent hydrolase of the beta-lactamase fold-like protein [uncultured bacterium]|nr:MAG: Zn-dependent hydrolase of the beta-lactamase fold-like protein [uncultured bacterium]
MQIQWTGLASFRIQTSHAVIVTDPFSDTTGLTMPKLKADLVLVSDEKNTICNNTKRLSGEGKNITGPGEYEIKNTFVYGVPAVNTLYLIEDDNISIAFLGALDSGLTNDQLEKLEGADILLLPVGTLSKEQRAVVISQLEPRVIIPYLFKQPKVKQNLEPVETFLKEMGVKKVEPIEKYVVKDKDLPQEDTQIILLSPTQA